ITPAEAEEVLHNTWSYTTTTRYHRNLNLTSCKVSTQFS
ncbi:uncharacterized, partial [Tachysurus ichikawai]